MSWFGDDITFCANKNCDNLDCYRNSKNITYTGIPHSYALFTDCDLWDDTGAAWLTSQMNKEDL